MKKVLVAKNIVKTYPRAPILSDVSLEISPGESVAISGRSGEGKSTLLHIFGTLEKQDSGYLEIDETPVTSQNKTLLRRKSIGFIFQAFHLMEDFSTIENVLMPAWIDRVTPDRKKALELLDMVGLLSKENQSVKLLSGGERQRVAIARALCNNPSLILADEPTGNLDKENSRAIGNLLVSITKHKKQALILVTHDESLALLCDQKYTLSSGKLSH